MSEKYWSSNQPKKVGHFLFCHIQIANSISQTKEISEAIKPIISNISQYKTKCQTKKKKEREKVKKMYSLVSLIWYDLNLQRKGNICIHQFYIFEHYFEDFVFDIRGRKILYSKKIFWRFWQMTFFKEIWQKSKKKYF